MLLLPPNDSEHRWVVWDTVKDTAVHFSASRTICYGICSNLNGEDLDLE